MSGFWSEERIAEILDGTFTRIHEGRTITEAVDDEYSPIINKGGRPRGTPNLLPHSFWKPEEDDLLVRQRLLGRPFSEIAWLLSRTESSAKKRHKVLNLKGHKP